MTIAASVAQALSRLEPEEIVSNSEPMHQIPETINLALTLRRSL
jgi:hypothetical protein